VREKLKMPDNGPIKTFHDFSKNESLLIKLRHSLRNAAIHILSLQPKKISNPRSIYFPYYHHVFDDERSGFEQHLKFFANSGDVICIDDAVALIESPQRIKGTYFCITFDDGFKNWIQNAVPILNTFGMNAAFFIATDYIGLDIEKDQNSLLNFYASGDKLVEFLSWKDCIEIDKAGMTIGSHTASHANLMHLSEQDVKNELIESKQIIEKYLKKPCTHFCCPFGRSKIDYEPNLHPEMARKTGYRSFLTGHRGANSDGASPFHISRDHLLANWNEYQLRYFFS
jgi:peptidoglycan/xylan/chitin deacetylase (PgdA/CDA1 family)